MPTRLLEILKPTVAWWRVIIFSFVTLAVLLGKDYMEYRREMKLLEVEKKADLELIAAQKEADSLRDLLAGSQRAKEAEQAINAIVKTEEITDRLAIDVQAYRAHVIKIHNHGALENGEIPDMSIFSEGLYSKETHSVYTHWQREPMPMGFIKHISTMLPEKGQIIDPYYRFRYVPDIALDSGMLAGPVSRGILEEMRHKSVITFWITTTRKGEIFFLNVAYDYADPVKENMSLIPAIRSATRAISRELEIL